MQTCPGFFLKSLLESPGNLLAICSVKFVDTLVLHRPCIFLDVQSVCMSICLCVLSVCLSVCVCVCNVESWIIYMNFQWRSLQPSHSVSSVWLSVNLSVCASVCLSVRLSVCLCVCNAESWVNYMNFQWQNRRRCHHASVSLGKVRLIALHMCVFTLPCLLRSFLHRHHHHCIYVQNTFFIQNVTYNFRTWHIT